MSKQRFEVKLHVEIRETTDSDGNPTPPSERDKNGKPFFSAMPICYHDLPLGGVVMLEQEVLKLQTNLVNLGAGIAAAVEGAASNPSEARGIAPTSNGTPLSERQIKMGAVNRLIPQPTGT